MKQIIALLTGLIITMGAMAYPIHGGAIGRGVAPHAVVVVRPSYYGGFGYRPYLGYNALYSPYYGYGYAPRPSKLDLNIAQINNDYSEQIADVRHDKSLSGSERRSQIRDLRHEKNNSIIQAKSDYYHPQRRTNSNNPTPDNSDVIDVQ